MLCPKCKCEMRIAAARTVAEGDTSPETETQVYTEQDLTCHDRACENYGRVVQTVRIRIL